MQVGRRAAEEDEAEGEVACENHTHRRVFLDPAVAINEPRGDRTKQACDKCSERQWQADDIGDYDPWKNRMGNGITHQRPTF